MSVIDTVSNVEGKSDLFNNLDQIVTKGLNLLKSKADDAQYQLWENYSKEEIRLAVSNTRLNLYAKYLDFLLSLYDRELSPEYRVRLRLI